MRGREIISIINYSACRNGCCTAHTFFCRLENNFTLPVNLSLFCDNHSAVPSPMVICPSCPQACMKPSLREENLLYSEYVPALVSVTLTQSISNVAQPFCPVYLNLTPPHNRYNRPFYPAISCLHRMRRHFPILFPQRLDDGPRAAITIDDLIA